MSCKSFFNLYFFPTGMPPRTSYHGEQIPKTRVAEWTNEGCTICLSDLGRYKQPFYLDVSTFGIVKRINLLVAKIKLPLIRRRSLPSTPFNPKQTSLERLRIRLQFVCSVRLFCLSNSILNARTLSNKFLTHKYPKRWRSVFFQQCQYLSKRKGHENKL